MTRTVKLNQAFVDKVPFSEAGPIFYRDADLKGFEVCVGKTVKTFYAGAEHKKKFVRVKIGLADVTPCNVARRLAQDVLLPELRRGIDPRAVLLSKLDETLDPTLLRILQGIRKRPKPVVPPAAKLPPTVGEVYRRLVAAKVASKKELDRLNGTRKADRASPHFKEQTRLLGGAESYIGAPPGAGPDMPNGFWDLRLDQITDELVFQVWRRITRTNGLATARKVFVALSSVSNYARKEGLINRDLLLVGAFEKGRGLPSGWTVQETETEAGRIGDVRKWFYQVGELDGNVRAKIALRVLCVSACNFDPLRRGIGVQF